MRRNTHRYFLRVDGNIVFFPDVPGFEDMDDFLKLSLFTSLYVSCDDLIKALVNMGTLNSDRKYSEVEIVKRKGNRKDGYTYEALDEDILLKKAARFMSVASIINFLTLNRDNYALVIELVDSYIDTLNRLSRIFEKKILDLKLRIRYASAKEEQELLDEIKKRENSLNNFNYELANLNNILAIVRILKSTSFYNRQLELEYLERLTRFVRNETGYYWRDRKVSTNFRGLVRLANTVQNFIERYPNIQVPKVTDIYTDEKIELLRASKNAIYLQESNSQLSNGVMHSEGDLYDVDPDSFMFLDEEDYMNLIRNNMSKEEVEGVEVGIENLIEQKRAYGKK